MRETNPQYQTDDYLNPAIGDDDYLDSDYSFGDAQVPTPVDWEHLNSADAEREWLLLNEWVEQLRHTYALPAQVIPPFWHRHRVLVEHLSALHTHHQTAFAVNQNGSAPFGWIRDLGEWELRVREIVARLGTRIDADRAHQMPRWPGEPHPDLRDLPPQVYLPDRYEDFCNYVAWGINRREAEEQRAYTDAAWGSDAA